MDEQRFKTLSGWQVTRLLVGVPLKGMAFVLFLPFIGFALVLWHGGEALWRAGVRVKNNTVSWCRRHRRVA